jgi:hypothetical protein
MAERDIEGFRVILILPDGSQALTHTLFRDPISAVNVAEQSIKEGEQGCAGARVVFQRGEDQADIIWEGEA